MCVCVCVCVWVGVCVCGCVGRCTPATALPTSSPPFLLSLIAGLESGARLHEALRAGLNAAIVSGKKREEVLPAIKAAGINSKYLSAAFHLLGNSNGGE